MNLHTMVASRQKKPVLSGFDRPKTLHVNHISSEEAFYCVTPLYGAWLKTLKNVNRLCERCQELPAHLTMFDQIFVKYF